MAARRARPEVGHDVHDALLARGRRLEVATIVWNLVEVFADLVAPEAPRATVSSPDSTDPRGPCRARFIRDGATGLGIEVRAGVHTGEIEIHGEEIHGSLSTSPRESSQWPSPVRPSCLAP